MSVFGPMVTLIIPKAIAFKDPHDQGRANFAWKFDLSRRQVRIVERWCLGMGPEKVQEDIGISYNPYFEERKKILGKMKCRTTEQAVAIAALYGLGIGASA